MAKKKEICQTICAVKHDRRGAESLLESVHARARWSCKSRKRKEGFCWTAVKSSELVNDQRSVTQSASEGGDM